MLSSLATMYYGQQLLGCQVVIYNASKNVLTINKALDTKQMPLLESGTYFFCGQPANGDIMAHTVIFPAQLHSKSCGCSTSLHMKVYLLNIRSPIQPMKTIGW